MQRRCQHAHSSRLALGLPRLELQLEILRGQVVRDTGEGRPQDDGLLLHLLQLLLDLRILVVRPTLCRPTPRGKVASEPTV
jgi:hypothetical protein